MEKENSGVKVSFTVNNYKDIRNFIHNYLGITKEEIKNIFWKYIEDIVNEEIRKCLADKDRIGRLLQDSIVNEIRRQDGNERHSYVISTMDDIYNKIDKVIHEEVRSRLLVELKEPDEKKEEISSFRYGVVDVKELPPKEVMDKFIEYVEEPPIIQTKDGERYVYLEGVFIKIGDGGALCTH